MRSKLLCASLTLVLLLSFLTGCGATKLKYDASAGSYTNKKTGVTYVHAEEYYEAVGVLPDRVTARIANDADVKLYEIKGADPTQMIATENLEIFCAEGTVMPKLWEMDVNCVYVGQVIEGATMDNAIATVNAVEDMNALVELYQNAVPFPESEMLDGMQSRTRYNLRFASASYPAFYYRLTYWHFDSDVLVYEVIETQEGFTPRYSGAEVTFEQDGNELCAVYNFGKNIIYDRVLRECYAVGDTVQKYLS